MSIMFSNYKPIRKVFKEVMEKSSIIFPYHFYDLPPAGDYKECRFKAFYPLSYTAYLMPLVEISLGKQLSHEVNFLTSFELSYAFLL